MSFNLPLACIYSYLIFYVALTSFSVEGAIVTSPLAIFFWFGFMMVVGFVGVVLTILTEEIYKKIQTKIIANRQEEANTK